MDRAHWSQVRGNRFFTKPTPDMVLGEVEIPLKNAMLKGESVLQRRTILVSFDVDFVLTYIQKMVIAPLNIDTPVDLEWLLTIVKDAYAQQSD